MAFPLARPARAPRHRTAAEGECKAARGIVALFGAFMIDLRRGVKRGNHCEPFESKRYEFASRESL